MSAFSPRQMFLLDLACKPIAEAFDYGVYLVGTAVTRQEYRDVDVRVIMADRKYDRMRKAVGKKGMALIGIMGGQYLASVTGLPVDFQLQRQTDADAKHDGPRNPLGMRTLSNFVGDAAPESRVSLRTSTSETYAEECPACDTPLDKCSPDAVCCEDCNHAACWPTPAPESEKSE